MEKGIVFITIRKDYNLGSYRIWIHDLNEYFKELGIDSKISDDINDSQVVIVGKGELRLAQQIKKEHPEKKVGLINPEGGERYDYCDFLIVGSIEEQVSLSKNKNVFLYPLIERLYQNIPLKNHKENDVIKFCFHGHYPHLAKFEPATKEALEEFSKERSIELLIIHGHPDFEWIYGKPNIKTSYKQWNPKTIAKEILTTDIGLLPNATRVNDYKLKDSMDFGLYETDYLIRFKNKSNAGRAFVFHQLGIPIVADLTPSHLHILGDPDHGYIAHDKNGWLKAFRELSSTEQRNRIARDAKAEFDRLYNPRTWATKLHQQINEL